MTTPLRQLLNNYRKLAPTEREKGTYLEKLTVAFIKSDATMQSQFEDAWLYGDWAKMQGLVGKDTGVDVVAKIRDSDKFCAVQCKFYDAARKIDKADLDSFFAASGTNQFARRMFIDTTEREWSSNAEAQLEDQQIECTRVSIPQLEASNIDWSQFHWETTAQTYAKKQMRPHQVDAVEAVKEGLKDADRGKVIMACGTGKTFTGLKFAEELAGTGGRILFLVPSLALMSQTIREWHNDASLTLRSYAVCSDSEVGKRRNSKEDIAETSSLDLEIPATTKAATIGRRAGEDASDKMTVVFSTYQSLQAISEAQKHFGLPDFDLIICDEAHRTTGATIAGEDDSAFVRVHDNEYIRGTKRIYMTATPRIYSPTVKKSAAEVSAIVYSMDEESLFGKDLFVRGFGWAVENKLLTDYKVLVLAIDEGIVSQSIQNRFKESEHELALDDATKIIGCYKALTKAGLADDLRNDPHPMRRALAFCKSIDASKMVTAEFSKVVNEFLASEQGRDTMGDIAPLTCELNHVDGTMDAKKRGVFLDWLKEDTESQCRILSNAKCLSEGVDVPALDAIMFMHPRKSQIDVVQSVGRVMRLAQSKKLGYVILPVAIPAGVEPDKALDDNERYKVVWQILNALRSHDERLEARLNHGALGEDISDHIEVVAVSNQLPDRDKKKKKTGPGIGGGSAVDDDNDRDQSPPKHIEPEQLALQYDEVTRAILAKIVKKCGNRNYWSDWSSKLAKIAEQIKARIDGLIAVPDSGAANTFAAFLAEIRDDLNESISADDAVEMLAQHMITKPVFDALFEGYAFAEKNPVSRAMEGVLGVLFEHRVDIEAKELEGFYEGIRRQVAGVKDAKVKQDIIRELYDNFFKVGFAKLQQKLGIVYTPVEVVDFIIHSVNEILQAEFGQTLGSKGVHILDPFTGTGTFITRILQSGLIKPEELEHKFKHEIHANEIVLLAYYIAAINIEAAYSALSGGEYSPFDGICLTDTFQLYEQDKDLIAAMMPENSNRRTRQKALDIRVIVGNPPYSIGQKEESDGTKQVEYPKLDERIRQTYSNRSKAVLSRGLFDSYIRAIRWASDRVKDAGIIAFISGSAWIERQFADGMRQALVDEFANIYVFNLRGDIRKNMLSKGRAGEGENIFGSGSMTGAAISFLVKNPDAKEHGLVHIYDIGNDLSQKQKLEIISSFKSVSGISKSNSWQTIVPDEHGDWLSQRDGAFDAFIALGDKKGSGTALFENFSLGVVTNRDSWTYNSSLLALDQNMSALIGFYDAERERLNFAHPLADRKSRGELVDKFIDTDSTKISWTRALKADLAKNKEYSYEEENRTPSLYRPFTQQYLYYSRAFNEMVYQMPRIFPLGKKNVENMVIDVSGVGARAGFTALMTKAMPSLDTIEKGQCFPRYLYEISTARDEANPQADLLEPESVTEGGRRDAITDEGLAHFQTAYSSLEITKDDLFYYVYGLLHSEDYRIRFADNLVKQLPRIPAVKALNDFWAFVAAGRELGDMHVNYDNVTPFPLEFKQGSRDLWVIDNPVRFYRVEKMKYGGKAGARDTTTVIYNNNITVVNIPPEAHEYVVNGKSAIDWVVERQGVKIDKASGIVNDANAWANETMHNPAYPLELLARVITVSLRTVDIVRNLPKLEI